MKFSLCALACAALFFASSPARAGSHTWSGAVNGNWSTAGNWSAGGVPTIGEASLTMTFPGSATRTVMTNNIGALTVTAMTFSGSNFIVRGASTITFGSSLINLLCSGDSNTIESTLSLPGNFAVSVGDNKVMAFHTLTGAGSLLQFGEGEIHLRGVANNSLSGGYIVNVGRLVLAKTGGATAVVAPLTIIGTTNFGQLAFVSLASSEQIAGNVNVIIHPTGGLYLNGFTNTINDLTVMAGAMDGSGGLLRLNGDIRLSALDGVFPLPDTSPILRGNLEFIGASNNITVSNLICEIEANIVEYGTTTTLGKDGPGTLWLKGGGNNPGHIYVNAGALRAGTAASLGTIAGSTIVANGASLIISSGVGTAEPLVLSGLGNDGQGALKLGGGTATCSGTITLGSETGVGVVAVNDTLNLDGPISGGGGIRKFGDGTLIFNGFGNNTFSGASFVAKGKLTLNKSANVRALGSVTVTNGASLVFNNNELMDNAGILSIYTGGIVNLLNRNETIGGLNIGGGNVVDSGTGTLTMLGNFYTGSPYSVIHTPATILGNLSLGGATRTVLNNNYDNSLVFDCAISDGPGTGGLRADGVFFSLLRSNSFTGPVLLNSAYCSISNSFAFGAPGGGVFSTNTDSSSAIIFLPAAAAVSGETLTVGNNLFVRANVSSAWNNPIVLTNGGQLVSDPFTLATGTLTVNGKISGNGNVWADSGTLRLTQSNDFTGIAGAAGGTLAITHPNALGATNQGTTIYQGSTLRLELPNGAVVNGEPLSFLVFDPTPVTNDSLTVAGAVSNSWNSPVIMDGQPVRVNVLDADGTLNLSTAIGGTGALEKSGFGKLILAGTSANTYLGDTTVTLGVLVLNKPDGVRATTNITVQNGYLRWGASEQVADGATVRIGGFFNAADLLGQTETITHLGLGSICYFSSSVSGGQLKLLGDIFPADDLSLVGYVNCPLVLGSGAHRISTTNSVPGELYLNGDVRDLTTNGGLSFSNMTVNMAAYATNTFSGPVNLEASTLNVFNRSSLGSPAQGVTMDQASALYLDLPHGQSVPGESLTVNYNINVSGFGARFGSASGFNVTNGWSGSIALNTDLSLAGPLTYGLELSGPITGSGDLNSFLQDKVFLTGTATNSFPYLFIYSGQARLAKTPGVRAVGSAIFATTYSNAMTEVHIDALGQLPPDAYVSLESAALYLHDHPTQVRVLSAEVGYSYVNCGNNPSTALTISNTLTVSGFVGDFNGTLIKKGAGGASFSGSFLNGDLFVEGGVLDRTCSGVVGQTVLSPGAVVNSSGPQIFNFGALSGAGTLNISGLNTWIGGTGNATTFTGAINGHIAGANLTKVGTGAITLAGPISLLSTTFVQNGTLLVNSTMNNPVIVTPLAPGNQPTLGGTGTVGHVTLTGVGARLAPGATIASPSYGRLRVNNLTFGAGTSYRCEIGGTNAGANLDQIEASGTVTLASANLEANTSGTGAISNRYAIVKSTPAIGGIFTGKSEGGTFFPSAGRSMQITYVGGASGHDIVLMDLSAIPPGSFNGVQVLPNGTVQLGGTGLPGGLYQVQANANLNTTNWLVIGTALANFNGAFSFVDTNAPSFPMRYYRFLLP